MFGNRNADGYIDDYEPTDWDKYDDYIKKIDDTNVSRAFRYLKFLNENIGGHPITHYEGWSVEEIEKFILLKSK